MELDDKQRKAKCDYIGDVCMTHARMKNICERLNKP